MKITVAGIGYVGLSLAVLLSKKNNVIAYDIDEKKIEKINKRKSPLSDGLIQKHLLDKSINLDATSNKIDAFKQSDYIIIATPTNFKTRKNKFDTSSIDQIIRHSIKYGKKSVKIIIKSTVPIGFTNSVIKKYSFKNIFFSPEFLREGKALHDNLYPSRIVVGNKGKVGKAFSKLLLECVKNKKKPKVILTNASEAESIKLFANSYLAMRVSFFNELDNFTIYKNLNTEEIIRGVSADHRIGDFYNNPSFGYGGYCLPKDTKQIKMHYRGIPNKMISAIVESNQIRKNVIINDILKKRPKSVGIYRLIMKSGSDNFRESAIMAVVEALRRKKIKIFIYEPLLKGGELNKIKVIYEISKFKKLSDIIIANRISKNIKDVKSKVYTRDLFNNN